MADSHRFDVTQDQSASDPRPGASGESAQHPDRIGRYRIKKLLGKGGFGLVYLAHDEQLDRLVAVKVPYAELVSQGDDADAYLAEARTVAKLDHPNIVPVHDAGRTDQCPCYVVLKYVPSTELSVIIKRQRPDYIQAAALVAKMAEALHYAHTQGLVHRDVKPGNILVDANGEPHLVDFGLALREETIGKGSKYAGTPAYMSPEQARGEGHRVDGRSDIFSLGVVLYELLVGRQPFRSNSQAELLEQVSRYEPRPMRQYDDRIPKELERIRQKAMAKRVADRYSTAIDLAEDLRSFLADSDAPTDTLPGTDVSVSSDTQSRYDTIAVDSIETGTNFAASGSLDSRSIKIVPKGLRSFDAHDADFFLELLPGPRDRDGLPDSLRFWKSRIEETDPDSTFAIGLIYGPSGCGKSSLVKAGLLPRLSDDVVPVYIESTADETEQRLLNGVRKRCPGLDETLNLREVLAAVRQGQGLVDGNKLVIIIDQFEQWLHANHRDDTELVQALRQCDGGQVQCVVMVRDDFWMAATRFMRALEVRLLEAENSAAVDLFPIRHAKKVLTAFGRAFNALPEGGLSREQKEFVNQSVAGLAEDEQVVCVRLALFAEMMKGKPWTPATLKDVGGTKGVGVTFLEETFSASTAPPECRYHQRAARAVLKALLPDSGTDLKGHMKSYQQLLESSDYAHRPRDFDDLIKILDCEIRLITPTDPAGADFERDSVSELSVGTRHYQLAHDYIVHSVRDWLSRKQQATRRGRAELRLAERAALWNAKPQNRHLPSWWEHLNIRLLTDRKVWTVPQRQMMVRAGRVHGVRSLLVSVAVIAVGFLGVSLRNTIKEEHNTTRAEDLVESLQQASDVQVPAVVTELQELSDWTVPRLRANIANTSAGSNEKLRLSLALLPSDQRQVNYLSDQLPYCTVDQFAVVRDALAPHKDQLTDDLWQLVQDEHRDAAVRFQAAAALADYASDDERWNGVATFVAQHLTRSTSTNVHEWLQLFQPASHQLTDQLTNILADRRRVQKPREIAAAALAAYLPDQPDRLADNILVADEFVEFSPLIAALETHAADVDQRLLAELQAPLPDDASLQRLAAQRTRQAMAGVTLVHLGLGESVWPRLQFTPDPSLRSLLTQYLGKLQVDYEVRAAALQAGHDASIRQALIESFGIQDEESIPLVDRNTIVDQLTALYTHDPDPGVHSSTAWTLRRWGIELPELPTGGPRMTAEQTERIVGLSDAVQVAEESWLREQPLQLPASLDVGLVHHFALDEAAGIAAANDVTGQPNGVLRGPGPRWVSGVVRGSLWLVGDGSHLACAESFDPERTDAFSFGLWFYIRPVLSRSWLICRKNDELVRPIGIAVEGETLKIVMNHYPPNLLEVRSNTHERMLGRWHHVCVAYNGSSKAAGLLVYLDGRRLDPYVVQDQLSKSIRDSNPWLLGEASQEGLDWFDGGIDDLRFYDRQLEDAEIQALYDFGRRTLAHVPVEERTAEQQQFLVDGRPDSQYLSRPIRPLQSGSAVSDLRDAWDDVPRWYINGQGQTMVVVPNPSRRGDAVVDHSYAISSTEVTASEFLRFRETHGLNREIAPSDECPVHSIMWYSAAAYCNWLSEQEGIPVDQWVYKPDDEDGATYKVKTKPNHLDLAGYRLPTVNEWEYAYRAGTTSTYAFGEPKSLIRHYEWTSLNSTACHPVGTLQPNRLGLFDMQGNVSEWCHDSFSMPDFQRLVTGGSAAVFPRRTRRSSADFSIWKYRNEKDEFRGFRPAKSLPELDHR